MWGSWSHYLVRKQRQTLFLGLLSLYLIWDVSPGDGATTTAYASFLQLNVLRSSLPHMLEVFLLGDSKLTMSPQGPFPRFQVLMFRRPLRNTEGLGVHQKLCCRHQEDKSLCNLNKCAIDLVKLCASCLLHCQHLYSICIYILCYYPYYEFFLFHLFLYF